MLNYIRNLFKKNKTQTKSKTIKEQLLELRLGVYVVLDLNHDICLQHIAKKIDRFDLAVLSNKQLKGLVKAVYVADTTGYVYVEIVGLVVGSDSATRKEYVVMESEIQKLTVSAT